MVSAMNYFAETDTLAMDCLYTDLVTTDLSEPIHSAFGWRKERKIPKDGLTSNMPN